MTSSLVPSDPQKSHAPRCNKQISRKFQVLLYGIYYQEYFWQHIPFCCLHIITSHHTQQQTTKSDNNSAFIRSTPHKHNNDSAKTKWTATLSPILTTWICFVWSNELCSTSSTPRTGSTRNTKIHNLGQTHCRLKPHGFLTIVRSTYSMARNNRATFGKPPAT